MICPLVSRYCAPRRWAEHHRIATEFVEPKPELARAVPLQIWLMASEPVIPQTSRSGHEVRNRNPARVAALRFDATEQGLLDEGAIGPSGLERRQISRRGQGAGHPFCRRSPHHRSGTLPLTGRKAFPVYSSSDGVGIGVAKSIGARNAPVISSS
jgi:hypothetical protein